MHIADYRRFLVLAACLALTGCGKSESKVVKVEGQKFIVISAIDCADNTGLDYDKCLGLIEGAIKEHDKAATRYTRLADCEKAEGANRCDRLGEKSYRARLSAFQIILSDKAAAVPLYAIKDDKPGFRSASSGDILPDTDNVTFTKSADDAAHIFADKKKG
ncbi:MAG: DUF1190 domain-containing protein [Deltaproteobacteria bacterium]